MGEYDKELAQEGSGCGFLLSLIVVIYLACLGYNHFIKYPIRYIGYFYPDYNELSIWIESEPLKSVEDCREWVDTMSDEYADIMADKNIEYDYNYDYECGKDCYVGDPYYQGVKYTCKTSVD